LRGVAARAKLTEKPEGRAVTDQSDANAIYFHPDAIEGQGRDLVGRRSAGQSFLKGFLAHGGGADVRALVDGPKAGKAFEALVTDTDLRARMGRAAAAHVCATLDWSAVIPRYLDLAGELAELRRGAAMGGMVNPVALDPFDLYRDYPTVPIRVVDTIVPVRRVTSEEVALHGRISGRALYKRYPVPDALLVSACDWLMEHGPADVAGLAQALNIPLSRALIVVLMLAKSDMVRLPAIGPRENDT
jgi:hypothetical protein